MTTDCNPFIYKNIIGAFDPQLESELYRTEDEAPILIMESP